MEPHTKIKYRVTFDEHDYVHSSGSAEASASEDEKRILEKTSAHIMKTSSAADCGCEGDNIMQSASSIGTSILDDAEEIKALKRKVNDLEAKNKLLDYEIEKVNLCLINERNKNLKLEKKLQFVKDNQDVFMKLKEAYVNMKYNEAAGRKMIEIREKGQQTWDGILCRSCIDSEQLRRRLQSLQNIYKECYIVKPFQLEQILNTVKYLKDLIDRREQTWSFNADRDIKIRTQIETLENENYTLREILKTRNYPLQESVISDSSYNSDLTTFKKIIIKYEKKMREIESIDKEIISLIPFNEKEKKIITHLMAKYITKKRDRSLEKKNISNGTYNNDMSNNGLKVKPDGITSAINNILEKV